MARIQVTVPLQVHATLSFEIDDEEQSIESITPEEVQCRINVAQRALNRRGDDENGIYFTIDGHDEPSFEDLSHLENGERW